MVDPTQELSEHYRSVRGYLAHVLTHISFEAGPAGRPLVLPPDPQPILDSLAVELDKTYREVARWLPDNPDVRFEKVKGKEELILTPLDALDEPPSLIWLQGRGGATTARGVGGAGTGGGRADRLHGSVYASDRSFCANCGFCLESSLCADDASDMKSSRLTSLTN